MSDSHEKNSLDRRGFLGIAGAAFLGPAGTSSATPAASPNPASGTAHFPSLNPASAPGTTIRLSSQKLTAEIDQATGALLSIENRVTSGSKSLRDIPFRITTTEGEISPHDCRLSKASHTARTASFIFVTRDLRIEIGYRIDTNGANALRKNFSVRNEGTAPVTLFEIVMFDWRIPGQYAQGEGSFYAEGINDIHFHRSGLWYNHSINLFLRDEEGGLFLGVENPFFQARYTSNRKVYPARVEVYYQPRWIIPPGETFEGDVGFAGVYRQEGVFRPVPDPVFFGGRERLKAELLNWGEVWAMQAYMHSTMTADVPRVDDFIPTEYSLIADPSRLGKIWRKKEEGGLLAPEEQSMLKHFGGGPFNFAEQELWYRLTPETVRIYKQAVDDAAFLGHFRTLVVPNLMAGHKGWFESPEEKPHRAQLEATVDRWYEEPAYPLWQQVARYAGMHGIGMFNFEIAGGVVNARHPEWRYVLADGTAAAPDCYANRQFAEWHAGQVDKALATHPISHWQWDEGWMDSIPFAVAGFIGDDAYCYATNHGHLPGDVRYHQFRNVMSTLQTLRRQRPNVRFVIVSGLIPGMPWVMKYVNNDSHTGSMEYEAWGDHNIYFLPVIKSRRSGSVNWLAHGISSGTEAGDGSPWYTMLEDPSLRSQWKQNWDRWMEWTRQHAEYLAIGRDLFAGPTSENNLQGTAHCLVNGGFIFLHNAGKTLKVAELPINRWLGLEEGERFRVEEVHPHEEDYGVWQRGDTFRIPVEPGSTLLLSLEGVGAPLDRRSIAFPAEAPVEKAFLSLAEVYRRLNPDDVWPAGSHGRNGREVDALSNRWRGRVR